MPKILVDSTNNISFYYRVFRGNSEYRQPDEETTVAKYFHGTDGCLTNTEIPLTKIPGYNITYMTSTAACVLTSVPTLIMLPGGPGFVDHSLYSDFWATLSDITQIIIVDQRGNGRSDRGTPTTWNLETCADDVKRFSDALGLCVPPIIAGVSWGGYVAMMYASKYPNHPHALILMHTEAKVNSIARQQAFAKRAAACGLSSQEIANIVHTVHEYDYHPTKEGVAERYMRECWGKLYGNNPYQPEDFARCVTNIPMRQLFLTQENLTFNLYPMLGRITCATLFIAGELDPGHPLSEAQKTAALIPNATFVVLHGVGAPTYRDDPIKTKKILMKFITSKSKL